MSRKKNTAPQKVRNDKVNKVLSNWTGLTDGLTDLNEAEVKAALDKELAGEKRPSFVSRLTGRLAKVRGESIRKAADAAMHK